MIKKIICFVLIAFCFVGRGECFPALTGRVVDNAHILTQQQKSDLTKVLEQIEPHQVVAVSLDSLDGQEIEDYGYQLGRHWGIGRKDINDGVLVLIAPNERQLRIEVGYGLEDVLTDAQSSKIVNSVMIPLARDGKYDEALIQGATAVVHVLKGETNFYSGDVANIEGSPALAIVGVISFVLFFVLGIGLGIVQNKCKYYKRSSRQNRILFFYENVLFQSMIYNIYVAILGTATGSFSIYLMVLIPVLLLVNLGNIRRWIKNPRFPYKEQVASGGSRRGSSGGGHSSSWGHSGGSSFHGGGGSFGGGGASGRF